MNSKITRLIALICAMLAISACFMACDITDNMIDTEGKNADSKTEKITETADNTEAETALSTADTAEETAEETDTEAEADNVYTIVVVDENGEPLSMVPVQICQGDICLLPTPTDANGVVEKAIDGDISEYTVKIPDTRYVSEEYYTFPEDSKVLTITVTLAQ